MNDHDTHLAFWKLLVAWVGALLGGVTLSQLVLLATLVYTVAQTFFLLRDKWWRQRRRGEHRARD